MILISLSHIYYWKVDWFELVKNILWPHLEAGLCQKPEYMLGGLRNSNISRFSGGTFEKGYALLYAG